MTRGTRNNNPANIRRSSSNWLGRSSFQTDKEFVQFVTMSFGLRAVMVLIRNYIRKGFDTPSKIINRYAPSSENDTLSYIHYVVDCVGSDVKIRPFSDEFFSLISAICFFESRFNVTEEQLHSIAKYFKLCKN